MPMKHVLLLVFCLISLQTINAQSFNAIDSIVATFPKKIKSPSRVAFLIKQNFDSDSAKARAIYTYVAKNVKYDIKLAEKIESRKPQKFYYKNATDKKEKLEAIAIKLANKTLKKRKGVCGGYAELYTRIAHQANLECKTVTGWGKAEEKDVGRFQNKSRHAWNSVKIGNEWKSIDVTWGAGVVDEDKRKFFFDFKNAYFIPDEEKFALNHYIDKKDPRTTNQFAKLPLFYNNYIGSKIEIICPLSGMIFCSKKARFIEFQFKNLPKGSRVSYNFGKDRYFRLAVTAPSGEYEFTELNYPYRYNDTLSIYVNGKIYATYKVYLR
jgi:hypothetical protein